MRYLSCVLIAISVLFTMTSCISDTEKQDILDRIKADDKYRTSSSSESESSSDSVSGDSDNVSGESSNADSASKASSSTDKTESSTSSNSKSEQNIKKPSHDIKLNDEPYNPSIPPELDIDNYDIPKYSDFPDPKLEFNPPDYWKDPKQPNPNPYPWQDDSKIPNIEMPDFNVSEYDNIGDGDTGASIEFPKAPPSEMNEFQINIPDIPVQLPR